MTHIVIAAILMIFSDSWEKTEFDPSLVFETDAFSSTFS